MIMMMMIMIMMAMMIHLKSNEFKEIIVIQVMEFYTRQSSI